MDYTKYNTMQRASTLDAASGYDAGLREYLLAVYRNMGLALIFTGGVAYAFSQVPSLIYAIYSNFLLMLLVVLAPVGLVFYMGRRLSQMSLQSATICFWSYSALMGVSLASIFLIYTGESIARVFFITGAIFGAMNIYGYTTKRDLTSLGAFMFMGLIGIVLASIVNIFLKAPGLQFVISIVGVVVFTGLTAYDSQKVKDMYYVKSLGVSGDLTAQSEKSGKIAIFGALTLYLDFINLFILLMQFMGNRKSSS